ncbi:pseudouridine synthase [Cupriavidus taiwanensis]|uniref:Dual-specificity RNA pseudouridine synthase RluF n=1 Tax=Cupriavidus taiwanensis TaxID=164546 RepID=A0A375IFH5_9BURK|nr:pseudouridine synthase [Cupriavidus taiwanensis]SOY43100.1 putative 16S rRNA uridine-516 pseudouridylate synthase [Cupriavidus taiwanensis]SOY45363.1 putative 16S rRNA uridine-516 pseudouridylate synthase [Cupriavidus taiwanensis]SOY80883.1 putative 16S rRNA uridine-516 pseudouridylate synthase [Cupriavidus taiwanensis]SOZ21870.1 putative 16S rRNA uridine-516 pseudouridylate synthase [Cupriavidus taiwanensis]SOZ53234.1 putative 16S rRNA uridine-516 pseudouridylate synthase [Cupriavidus taiw
MTDSNSPKRKTLGIKAASETGTAARKGGNRPVRVSDLNRNRVRAVTEGIKRAQQSDGGKSAGRRAPGEAQAGGDVRKPRPPRPADGERQARPRRPEGEARAPRRFGDDESRPRRYGDDRGEARPRRAGDDRGEARPRRFEGGEARPPRRFGDDDNRPRRAGNDRGEARPRRFEGGEARPPRRFGDDDNRPRRTGGDRAEARPRRFEGSEARPPRRFGDDDNRPRRTGDDRGEARPRRFEGADTRPRRFGDDENRPRRFENADSRPRRHGDDDKRPRPAPSGERRREGTAPARRFSDAADRIRTAGPARQHAPAARQEKPAPVRDESTHDDGLVRLSKRMSELGLCSRREADEWIPRGWVLVDGKPVTELGSRIRPDAEIEILQEARSEQGERVTVLLNKPVGYVSGQAEDGYEPAAALFAPENQWEGDPTRKRFAPWQRKNLAPAGRLDIDSTGLLVLTQDGRVARALIGEDSTVEKEYLVRVVWHSPHGPVERNISAEFPADDLELLRHGLSLDGVPLRPAKVSWQNEEQLRFVLREGRKRQIRRMCEQVGLQVVGLKRVRMGRVVLGDLPPGKWRFLGQFEKF